MTDGERAPGPAPDTNFSLELSVRGARRPEAAEPEAAAKPEARPRAPWLTPVTAPILVALLASVAPVTAAVNAHYQAELQLELDRQKQADDRTRLYLERAISQDAGAESRVQVLRFLQLQSGDPVLQQWAIAELAGLSEEVVDLKQKEEALVSEVAQTQEVVAALSREQEEIAAKLLLEPAAAQPQLRAKLETVKRSLEREREGQAAKSARLSRLSERLHGREAAPTQVTVPLVTTAPAPGLRVGR